MRTVPPPSARVLPQGWKGRSSVTMEGLRSMSVCAAVFALLKLGTDAYHAAAYGIERHWSSAVAVAVVVCAAGTLGYAGGALVLRRLFGPRTVVFIAILSYFVAYSVTRLLATAVGSAWTFIAAIFAVTLAVSISIGPKWED